MGQSPVRTAAEIFRMALGYTITPLSCPLIGSPTRTTTWWDFINRCHSPLCCPNHSNLHFFCQYWCDCLGCHRWKHLHAHMDVWAIKHGVSRLGFGPMPLNKKMWYDLNLGGIMGCPWATLQGSYPHFILLVPIVGNVCDPVLLEGCLMLTSIIPILTTHIHYDYDYQLPTQVHWNQAAKLHRWLHTSCKRVAWAATLGWHGLESTSKMLMGKRSCSSHALVIQPNHFYKKLPTWYFACNQKDALNPIINV